MFIPSITEGLEMTIYLIPTPSESEEIFPDVNIDPTLCEPLACADFLDSESPPAIEVMPL